MTEPRFDEVQCLSPAGLHTMRWTEWGAADNPRVLLCVHGADPREPRLRPPGPRDGAALPRRAVPTSSAAAAATGCAIRWPIGLPQYVADMVTLLARFRASDGALGRHVDGRADRHVAGGPRRSPVERLVINDVGPRLNAEALARIGSLRRPAAALRRPGQAIAYVRAVSAPFGVASDDEWREITESGGPARRRRTSPALRPAHRRTVQGDRRPRRRRGRSGAVAAVRRQSAARRWSHAASTRTC